MKRLILVTTPGNGKTYEFTVETSARTGDVRIAIVREIIAFENNRISINERDSFLCSRKYQERRQDSSFLFEGAYADDCEFYLV